MLGVNPCWPGWRQASCTPVASALAMFRMGSYPSLLAETVSWSDDDVMQISGINARLQAFYSSIWIDLVKDLAGHPSLSSPLFINVPPTYAACQHRLLIVGQQTNGWQGSLSKQIQTAPNTILNPVGELLGAYSWFERGKSYRSTPFWRYAHKMQCLLNPGADRFGFLWSNLLKVDEGQKRPSRAVEDVILGYRMLQTEIKETSPTVVLFFTGPEYDDVLRRTFPDVVITVVPNQKPRLLAKVHHPELPVHSYRTYHPGYLVRARKRQVLDDLASLIKA